jgi:hypothetical protein
VWYTLRMTQTEPDIDTLEAGPELDRLVTERVMGWVMRPNNGLGGNGEMWWFNPTTGFPCGPCEDWSPSQEIGDAWCVVEKARLAVIPSEDGWYASAIIDIEHDSIRPALTLFGTQALADTAPLAICRAALKAAAVPPSP